MGNGATTLTTTTAVLLASLTFATPAHAVHSTSAAVLVNELAAGSTGFVELVNDSTASVDLSGWAVRTCTRGSAATLAALPAGLAIDPGEFLLLTAVGFGGTATTHMVVPRIDGSGVSLVDAGGDVVDAVDSVEGSDCSRGRPAPVCASGSTARDAASDNSLDNAHDFSCRERTPGAPNN